MKKIIIVVIEIVFILGVVLGINNLTFFSFIKEFYFTLNYKIILYYLLNFICNIIIPFVVFPLRILLFFLISGFMFANMIYSYGIMGLFAWMIYLIIMKVLPIFLNILGFFYSIKLIKHIYQYIKYKQSKKNIKIYYKKVLVVSFLYLICNLLLYLIQGIFYIPVYNHLLF